MRAYTFTNYAGRFLYVEAHNKAHTNNAGPTQAVSYAGPDGTFSDAVEHGQVHRRRAYMYHQQLIALRGAYANIPTKDITVRVAAATGARDTATPIEWAGSGAAAARRRSSRRTSSRSTWTRPRSMTRIDDLAAAVPRDRRDGRRCRTTPPATSVRRWR